MARIKPVQVLKRGNTYQLCFYTAGGERRRLSAGSDYHQAQRLAVKFTDWIMEGMDPEAEIKKAQEEEKQKGSPMTLRKLYPVFMERHGSKQSRKMQESYHYSFQNICRCGPLADTPLHTITKGLMIDYMNHRMKLDRVTAATVNKEASFVRGLLSRAVEWDLVDRNPLYGLRMFKESEKRDVLLSPDQAALLLNELTPPIACIVEFAIYSGFRKENILGLKIEDIRFDENYQTGEINLVIKGGRRETFPLGRLAVIVLKQTIGNRSKGFVFMNPETHTRYFSINKAFDLAVRKLGFEVNGTKLRFHDLRHVFATWLHQQGVSLDTIRPLLGHRNRSTTDRYTTFDRMECGKALENLPTIKKTA